MRPGVDAHFLSKFKPLGPATLTCLEEQPAGAFSGVSRDGKACWIVRGALLEVIGTSTGRRLAAWQFGRVLGDEHTSVTCVEEFRTGRSLKLLVGVCNVTPVGLLCVFDVSLSKVIKAVEIPHPVTEIELVSTLRGNDVPRWALSEHLCYFCGIVAVGTNTGKVFLVDMCTDDEEFFSDEEVPSKVHFISPRIRDTENQRFHCMSQGLHLAITLNENMITRNGFEYQKPDGLVMKTFPLDTVTVSCLRYIPQAGILTVGYSFGCYQLWKLNVPVLEYSSRLEPDPVPITHIAYQEPENDPKNFCYIWVARGQKESEDEPVNSVSSISMYQLAFNHKTFYSNYGVYYEELTSVCLRLDHEMTSRLVQFGTNFDGGSKVIACYTLVDPYYQPPARLSENDSFEESCHGPDLSLCVFVWEATEGSNMAKAGRHLGIFDINRWYHAQMPSSVRYVSGSPEMCAFFCSCRLDEALESAGNDSLLMAHVKADRLRKFYSNSPVPPEQHFYPSSLAFDVTLVFETGIMEARYLGSQRQVLATMESTGPTALVSPLELYNLCIQVGLLPRPVDIASVNPNIGSKRQLLLGLALEYNMLAFLKNCITTWASGEFELQGCTLKFLLDWAWDTVSNTKHKVDSICVTLYNWSGLNLDQRSLQTLYQCNQRLDHLVSLFKTFVSQTGPITQQGETELQSKILVTNLLSQHLSVVLWFVGAGLLPEADDTEVTLGGLYSYPAISLMSSYKHRREELQNIHSDIGETDILMIDGLVEAMGVADLWEREGGTGRYPPPSLHALLSSYLLENCDMMSKHCLVLYLLLDLVSVDSSEENGTFSEKVSGFAQRFHLPPTLVKLIQGFWLLDHRDFEEALRMILDPMVKAEFSRWQHKKIIKALLYQGDAKMALRYITSVQPALTTPEEVKLKLTILLANGLTADALEYQRKCRDKNNFSDLVSHLFLGCQQTKTVDRLLQLPLSGQEETILVDFLLESSEPDYQELLVMHYLQRGRIVEAIQLNEKLKHSLLNESSSKSRERAAARNAIVESYAEILPNVQRRLMFEQLHVPKKNTQWRREVRRPTPLSTTVTKTKAQVMSQSAFILTVMEKLDEIDAEQPQTEMLDRSVGPFICTPVTPARKSQRDTPATLYPEADGKVSGGQGLPLNKSISIFCSTDTPTKLDKRTSRYFSASCLTILQTPVVKKVTPRKQRLSTSNVITPQSILKVRNMISTTSPSPHSASTTPTSQELEGSARKMPRKLGYGSGRSTPLSSLPHHLTRERTFSAASSPKSVSFAEPSSTTASPSDLPRSSQSGTSKSVSFLDNSLPSASKLQPMTTPKHSTLRSRLQGSAPGMTVSPNVPSSSSRSLRDRSPTPESLERSPRFVENLDQLHRRPLHTPEKQEADLKPRLQERDNTAITISDEDVEMEGIVSAADTSVSSTATLRDQQELHESESPEAHSPVKHSPVRSLSPTPVRMSKSPVSPEPHSPVKHSPVRPASPATVRVSKSPVSVFTSAADRKFSELDQNEAEDKEQTGSQKIDVDLTEDDDMEVVQEQEEPYKTKEIFEEHEEINPPGEIEEEEIKLVYDTDEEINPLGEIEEMEAVSSTEEPVNQSMEQVSHVNQSVEFSIKQEVEEEEFTVPPEPVRHLELPAPPSDQVSPSHRQTPTSLSVQASSPVKVKDSPPSADYEVQSTSPDTSIVKKSSPTFTDNILAEIDKRFGDSPDAEEIEIKPRAGAKGCRTRKKFDIKFEQEHEPSTSATTPQDEELSDSEGNQKVQERIENVESDDNVVTQEPMTPTRSSRRLREKNKDLQQEPTTPTRRSARLNSESEHTEIKLEDKPVTPSRLSWRKTSRAEDKPDGTLVEVSATSPRPFSRRAKEAVQESLIQISEEMREQSESSPGSMTRIKEKGSRSPARRSRSPARTPTLSQREQKETLTPTRRSARLVSMSEDTENDENVPSTPSRSARGRGKKATTPKRGRKIKEEIEQSLPEGDVNQNNASSPSKSDNDLSDSAKITRTPTRGWRKKDESVIETIAIEEPSTPTSRSLGNKENVDNEIHTDSFGASAIPEDFVDMETDVETTPSRRKSLSRACKQTESDLPKTPTRRQSLGRNAKLGENAEVIRTPTRRQSLRLDNKNLEVNDSVKTPTRRKSLGRDTKKLEDIDEVPKTPNRRQTVSRTSKANAEMSPESAVQEEEKQESSPPRTPSRRGRGRKVDQSTVEEKTETKTTPSRRGRSKKTEESPDKGDTEATTTTTPSRKGRPKKVKTEPEEEMSNNETDKEVELKATRSKRAKKDKEEGEASPATHTRSHDTNANCASAELFDVQNNSFKFSDPMQVDASEQEIVKPFTPVKSFIFSPPISRARSKLQEEKEDPVEGILLPPGPSTAQIKEQAPAKSVKKKRTKRLYSEEEILLISPIAVGVEDTGEEGRGILTRSGQAGTQKVDTKKAGNEIVIGRRHRTSHRMGPVGKRKTDK